MDIYSSGIQKTDHFMQPKKNKKNKKRNEDLNIAVDSLVALSRKYNIKFSEQVLKTTIGYAHDMPSRKFQTQMTFMEYRLKKLKSAVDEASQKK